MGLLMLLIPLYLVIALPIYFEWEPDISDEIDESQLRLSSAFANRIPRWSPDGTAIVVNIGSEIYAVSVEGDRVFEIPKENGKDHHFSPSLSPDGRVVYTNYHVSDGGGLFSFLRSKGHKRDIRSANIDGTDAKRIFSIDNGKGVIHDPVWSPEGSRIAFRTINSIWTMARDGSDAHPIESLKIRGRPVWSNDGQRIAAVEREWMGMSGYRYSISNVKWDGTDKKIVVELQERGVSLAGPVWSHTDDLIYFIKREKVEDIWKSSLYSARPDGADLRMIADLSEFWRGGNFAPSPGGGEVLFVHNGPILGDDGVHESNTGGIYVIDADGTGIRLIARIRGFDRAPSLSASWSQDGKRIAVANNSATPKAPVILFTMAPDGSDIRVLLKREEDGTPQPGHGEPLPLSRTHTHKLSPDVEPCQSNSSAPAACAPRDVSDLIMMHPRSGAADGYYSLPDVEELLERGMHGVGASPTHLAFRGAVRDDTTRCAWHGVARSSEQREKAIRFWLGIHDDQEPIPSPSELEDIFNSSIEQMDPRVHDVMRVNFMLLAHGGLSMDALFLACYTDYDVHEYILGNGPAVLTVAYDNIAEGRSYDLYLLLHEAGMYGDSELLTQSEYADRFADTVSEVEARLVNALEGSESVVFLVPMAAHNSIAIEAWQAVAQWDLQSTEGIVNAIRYGTDKNYPQHSQPLSSFKTRISAAVLTDDFAGKRIANIDGLSDYYQSIGAYDNPDVTPALPPPIPGEGDTYTPGTNVGDSTDDATPSVPGGLVDTPTPDTAATSTAVSVTLMPTHTPMPETAATPQTELLPPAPLNLTATSTAVSVTLTWDAPHDDAEVTSYQILRKAEQDQEFTTLNADTGSARNEYIDTDDVQPGTVYEYRVRAINSHGVGPPSEPVRIIVPHNP